MTNNSDMSVVFLSLLHNLQLTQQAALVNSMLFLNIFKILKMSFWHFEGKIAYILPFGLFFFIKSCKAFRIAQSKWPQLVKPCFDSDLYFTFKTSGRALLEAIVSYKVPPILSQENKEILPPAPLGTSITVLMCIFSSILSLKMSKFFRGNPNLYLLAC